MTSLYDPEVEFLELGLVVQVGKEQPRTIWKVYGPSNSGTYGENNGIGSLEAVFEADTGEAHGIIHNIQGDIIASVDSGKRLCWQKEVLSCYGPIEVPSSVALETAKKPGALAEAIIEASTWKGRRVDPTGFVNLGARHYDPLTGSFLSCDPLGHAATPDLYAYADGDPVNNIDPDGRFASEAYRKAAPVISTVVDFIPGAGTAKAAIETAIGRDVFTGETTSRIASGTGLAMSLIPIIGPTAAKAGKAVVATERVMARQAMRLGENVAQKWSMNAYSVAFETKLGKGMYPGKPRSLHFKEANNALYQEIKKDKQFSQIMNNLIPNLEEQLINPNGIISSRPPQGWTWHHHVSDGIMQLIPKEQHTFPGKIQNILHPNNKGGMAIWGQ